MTTYYTVSGAPSAHSYGSSAYIRAEFISIQTAFGTVNSEMIAKGAIAGQAWTGAHDFTAANITVPTQPQGNNSTKAATTAYADAAVASEAGLRIINDALKANKAGETYTGTHDFTVGTTRVATAPTGSNNTLAANMAAVKAEILAGVTGYASTIIETATATASQTVFNLTNTYTVGVNGINVYINGVRQFPSAFTETSTSVITLSSGAMAGDVVMFEIGVITSGTATAASAVTFNPTALVPEVTVQAALANIGRLPRSARTSNTILGVNDRTYLIDITSGTFSQTFDGAATLSSGWYCILRNSGTGDITLDPSSSELIDGLTSYIMYPGECRLIQCTGTGFTSVVLTSFNRTYTSTATFTTPPGYKQFAGHIWGGGGGGGRSNAAGNTTGGGGGGACVPFSIPNDAIGASQTITIAAGGAAQTGVGNGGTGGTSSIGSIVSAYGGGGGYGSSANGYGGGGGGALSAGSSGATSPIPKGGSPSDEGLLSGVDYGRDGQGLGGASAGFNSAYGGSGGGSSGGGGNSVYGGAGGGGVYSSNIAYAGGTSSFGGAGGAGGVAVNGTAGTVPGGGGGATHTGASSGAGANGKCIIWGVI